MCLETWGVSPNRSLWNYLSSLPFTPASHTVDVQTSAPPNMDGNPANNGRFTIWTGERWISEPSTVGPQLNKKKHPSNLGTAWIEMHRQLIVDQSLRGSEVTMSSKLQRGKKPTQKHQSAHIEWVLPLDHWHHFACFPNQKKPKKNRFPVPSISRCDDKKMFILGRVKTLRHLSNSCLFFVGVRGRQPNESERNNPSWKNILSKSPFTTGGGSRNPSTWK